VNYTLMLQLTETNNGQISGVVSWLELRKNGDVKSGHKAISGSVDGDQLVVKIESGLESFLFGTTVAGTVSGNTIKLQHLDGQGAMASDVFTRSSVATFEAQSNELKKKGTFIVNSNKLMNGTRELRDVVSRSEAWIANAQQHAQRLPNVKARYEQIETEMRSMVATERRTGDGVQRAQISVAVSQGDIAGGQVDIEVNQIWDLAIASEGASLSRYFGSWDGSCAEPPDLHQRASAKSIESWELGCKQAAAERNKLMTEFKRIMQQRAELKSLQAESEAHRKALVDEADRLQ
jgi:hypothetical protein